MLRRGKRPCLRQSFWTFSRTEATASGLNSGPCIGAPRPHVKRSSGQNGNALTVAEPDVPKMSRVAWVASPLLPCPCPNVGSSSQAAKRVLRGCLEAELCSGPQCTGALRAAPARRSRRPAARRRRRWRRRAPSQPLQPGGERLPPRRCSWRCWRAPTHHLVRRRGVPAQLKPPWP